MQPGDLVVTDLSKQMYEDISTHHRLFAGTFFERSVGILLDMGYSLTDMPYLKIMTDRGITGWIRPEGLQVFSP
jgi:hypothetical protein